MIQSKKCKIFAEWDTNANGMNKLVCMIKFIMTEEFDTSYQPMAQSESSDIPYHKKVESDSYNVFVFHTLLRFEINYIIVRKTLVRCNHGNNNNISCM